MSDDYDRVFGGRTPAPAKFTDQIKRQTPVAPPIIMAAARSDYRPYGVMAAADIAETCDVQRWMDGTEIAEGIAGTTT